MKKLTILSFAIALMGIMAAMPVRAQQFRFCENEYTADATIPLGGGTATWNQAKTTLTLKNVKAENVSGYFIFCEGLANLKIVLEGSNSVKCSNCFLLWKGGNTEILGKGSLTVYSNSNEAIYMGDHTAPRTLTIKDCTLDVQGKEKSISGYCNGDNTETLNLVVDNATLKVKGATGGWGWKDAGISYLKSYQLKNCHISTVGVKFGKQSNFTYYELLGTDGNTYYGEVEIVPGKAPTDISAVTADASQGKRGIYTLDGIRFNGTLNDLPAGIYIINGRKVVK
ncbi:hypothetical protein [Hoylesella marshii]|uniref:Uncharacterized protein n=1 Tax=Hoylesella marshii DSM 16973 = JCM 13450 TaxID=862515 RepID=E0NTC0_9BACT|nr:hypothetical protein [Hoylesella marshii]EFM01587.1 hypothetical protein HMPREF0658_1422 [Hoylesella marshii DSM 16973 = JCM 13450]